jgi:hypothetical protein
MHARSQRRCCETVVFENGDGDDGDIGINSVPLDSYFGYLEKEM